MTASKPLDMSPEVIIMLSIAVVLDIAGVICTILILAFGIWEILSYITDAMGILVFGTWLLAKPVIGKLGETIGLTEDEEPEEKEKPLEKQRKLLEKVVEKRKKIWKAAEGIKKAGKVAGKGLKGGLKFAGAIIGELIPIIGTLPFWTLFVWFELKS